MASQQDEPNAITRPFLLAAGSTETVKVASDETPSGYMIINASDFDAKSMKLYGEKAGKKSTAAE